MPGSLMGCLGSGSSTIATTRTITSAWRRLLLPRRIFDGMENGCSERRQPFSIPSKILLGSNSLRHADVIVRVVAMVLEPLPRHPIKLPGIDHDVRDKMLEALPSAFRLGLLELTYGVSVF